MRHAPLMSKALALSLGSLAALSLFACDHTAEGLKKDADHNGAALRTEAKEFKQDAAEGAEKAAEAVAGATETAGIQAAGARVTLEVKTALMADSRIDASRINIDSDGALRLVHIRGQVTTQPEVALATLIAAEKAPGWTVSNELTVAPKTR